HLRPHAQFGGAGNRTRGPRSSWLSDSRPAGGDARRLARIALLRHGIARRRWYGRQRSNHAVSCRHAWVSGRSPRATGVDGGRGSLSGGAYGRALSRSRWICRAMATRPPLRTANEPRNAGSQVCRLEAGREANVDELTTPLDGPLVRGD